MENSFNLDSSLQPGKLGNHQMRHLYGQRDILLCEMRVGGKAEKLFAFFTVCLALSSEESGTSCCWGGRKKTLLDPCV